jgi:hypothetical protein
MTFGWTFFGPYRQMAANILKNLLARHRCVTNRGTTKHKCLRMLCSTRLYSSTLQMMMPLLHLLSRRPCMTPLQLVLLHQPIQTWMNECATFFLTSLVRHTQMRSRTSSSPVSRNRQRASTASGCNRKLRIFLQRIYVNAIPMSKTGQAISHNQWSGIRRQAQRCHVSCFQPQADDATTCAH